MNESECVPSKAHLWFSSKDDSNFLVSFEISSHIEWNVGGQ